ncbi:T9SS type A sorting domain-containing protein [bacterium]|nr:T9SS type A sorting domain-containing protein [bacterium]
MKVMMPIVLIIVFFSFLIRPIFAQDQMETLGRGLIAVMEGQDVYLGWRLLESDPDSITFNIYRGETCLNELPITRSTNFLDTLGTSGDFYHVVPVLSGIEQEASDTVTPWTQNYLTVPLQRPAGWKTPDNVSYSYSPNDCSTGDLDGDGEYEIVVKWDPSNSHDNAHDGYTGNVFLDGYEMDGTHLWRIDLGVNIRAGAHYTQFMVYDLDGDGISEVACKTADGTVDGLGQVIGDAGADYRNSSGRILSGPEFFTIFSGQTGGALATTDYLPARGIVSSWGDSYGNRVDRFLACVAYLDGSRPSVVMCRGYYTRTVLVAWDWRNNTLTHRWTFDSSDGYPSYAGQGNHNLSVADVDEDGKDEIIYGACAIDDNGKGLWNSNLKHGDAMHLSDIDPDRPGLELWSLHGENSSGPHGSALHDARTGEIIWATAQGDVGRGTAANLVSEYRGMECWGGTSGLRSCKDVYAGPTPSSTNHVVWWDGDLCRELLDSNHIRKYRGSILLLATGCSSNNGTKSNPCLQADLFGDWREEVIWRTSDNQSIRIYTTTDTTGYRLTTLMHDRVYRLGIAWQNVAYNQPPHTSYYVGEGMFLPDSLRPPAPPFHFVAEAFTDSVKLSWDANFESDLDGYNIYRARQKEGPFIKLTDVLLTDIGYTDIDVFNDTTYYYTVTAVDIYGNESSYTYILKAITTIRPDYPIDLYARNSLNSVKLFWDVPDETNIIGYNVYRSFISGEQYEKMNTEFVTQKEYIDEPLPKDQTLYYVITSVNKSLLESFYSEELDVTTGPFITLQAENGVHGGTVYLDSNHIGFYGTGFVNFDTNGSSVQFNDVPGFGGGTLNLVFRYALGNTNRTGSLIVNGQIQSLTMISTGEWTNWSLDSTTIALEAGFQNTIRFVTTGSDFGNLDQITIGPDFTTDIHVSGAGKSMPSEYALHANYPNPFNPETTIPFDLPEAARVQISIYDVTGKRVYVLTDQNYPAGYYKIKFNAESFASGVYIVQSRMGRTRIFRQKIMVIK